MRSLSSHSRCWAAAVTFTLPMHDHDAWRASLPYEHSAVSISALRRPMLPMRCMLHWRTRLPCA